MKRIIKLVFLLAVSIFTVSCGSVEAGEKYLNEKYISINAYKKEQYLRYNNQNISYNLYINYLKDGGHQLLKVGNISDDKILVKYQDRYLTLSLYKATNIEKVYILENELVLILKKDVVLLMTKESFAKDEIIPFTKMEKYQ